ncbi:hypothetical protein PFISCL1PPCAC_27740 [Pristionchus fissidentatus]|uniref:Uncharacterized protein n=1 Tax=Pristionchus fissidentatus TaxID=1538716 RepID=A0AAV5X089_9BILA|nr:hypothetical protein PFISCL1PPCAC_27740 [Pristionchus fissidentatus]
MSDERFRLVVLGSTRVGKTSVIRRYLYKEFSEKYKETVEDLHSRQFRIRGVPLPLDILDTNFHFPDMRRLAISSASAFMLVFSVDDVKSFKEMSDLWKEVCDRRPDIATIPTVVVGNKCDQPGKKIYESTARAWISRLCAEVRYVECSAKSDTNIVDCFRSLLELSGFPKCKAGGGSLDENEEENLHIERQHSFRGRPLNRQVFGMEKEKEKEQNGTITNSLVIPAELKRNRSLRMKSPRREKEGDEENGKLTRSKSLIKRTKHLSLKMRRHGEKVNDDLQLDESDCIIS